MPIYEYQCDGCGTVFEETQKMSDPPLKKHAACGSKKVKKLISSTSFQLKGSGWYVTDYKKPSGGAEAKPSDSKDGGDKSTSDKSAPATSADATADKANKPAEKADKKSKKAKGAA